MTSCHIIIGFTLEGWGLCAEASGAASSAVVGVEGHTCDTQAVTLL